MSAPTESIARKPRVLVVDDVTDTRDVLRELLDSEGIEWVGEAVNGRQAIELATKLRPDVVVMDAHMPDMDGLMATKAIKDVCPATKVIMFTVYDSPELNWEAGEAGVFAYLVKGCSASELRDAIFNAHKLT